MANSLQGNATTGFIKLFFKMTDGVPSWNFLILFHKPHSFENGIENFKMASPT